MVIPDTFLERSPTVDKPTPLDELSDQDVALLLEEVDLFFDRGYDVAYLLRCPTIEKRWNAVKDEEDDLVEWAENLRQRLYRKAVQYMLRCVYVPFFTVEKKASDEAVSPSLIISRRGRSVSINPEAFFTQLFDLREWSGDMRREILSIVQKHLLASEA
jgi:hypothetical protein